MTDLSTWADNDKGWYTDDNQILDHHFREFETEYKGKTYTTYCREHRDIPSPLNWTDCDVTDSGTAKYAKFIYYYAICKDWQSTDAGRLRISRTLSYINGHSCQPFKESVIKGWIDDANAQPKIPDAAEFEIYLITPANNLQPLVAYDGKMVIKLKLKKASANKDITG